MSWKQDAIGILETHNARKQSLVSMSLAMERLAMEPHYPKTQDQKMERLVAEHSLQQSYRQTALLVQRTQCALEVLTPAEQQVLEMLYIYPKRGNCNILLCLQGICKSTLYRRRDLALQKFTVALYGS